MGTIRQHDLLRVSMMALLALMILNGCSRPHQFYGTVLDPPQPVYDMTGENWNGEAFRLSEHLGKVVLIFFGYTFCPDVCPLTLAELKQLHAQLGTMANQVEVVFISVDPDRDTPARLETYMTAFSRDFYGLHVEGRALEAAKLSFGVTAEKSPVDAKAATAEYFVDHSGWIYVIDRTGQLREVLRFDAKADDILPDIQQILQD